MFVKAANWLTHLEYDWESPVSSPLLQRLAERSRLIRYDSRGNGLSDRDVQEIALGGFVRDLEAVTDASKVPPFAILGISQADGIAIAYAVAHPEMVTKLILYGGYPVGRNKRGSADEADKARVFLSLLRRDWGDPHSVFMRAFSSVFIPNGSPEQIKWLAELQRKTTAPENAARIRNACDDIDVTELLPMIQVPTLVLHSRHDNVVPLERGQSLAASIRNARFVSL